MLRKNECDLIWKIIHGAIPAGRFLYGCKFFDSPNCNYCGLAVNVRRLGNLIYVQAEIAVIHSRLNKTVVVGLTV